jgi:hypothetical protein
MMNLLLFSLVFGSLNLVLSYPFFAYGLGILIALLWAFSKKSTDFIDLLGAAAFGPLIVGGFVIGIKLLFNTTGYALGASDSDITGILFTTVIAIIYAIHVAWKKYGPKQNKTARNH